MARAPTPGSTRKAVPELDAAIAAIAAMDIGELRTAWRKERGSEAPRGLTKDLVARSLAYGLQEGTLGGLPPATIRLLRDLAKPSAEPPRHIKAGSVIVREYEGVLHEVLVIPGGFCWQGKTYESLSTIAKTITGTSWNGPRFFGLRGKRSEESGPALDQGKETSPSETRRSGRRSSIGAVLGSRTDKSPMPEGPGGAGMAGAPG